MDQQPLGSPAPPLEPHLKRGVHRWFQHIPAMISSPNQKLDLTAHGLYCTQYVHPQPREDLTSIIQDYSNEPAHKSCVLRFFECGWFDSIVSDPEITPSNVILHFRTSTDKLPASTSQHCTLSRFEEGHRSCRTPTPGRSQAMVTLSSDRCC